LLKVPVIEDENSYIHRIKSLYLLQDNSGIAPHYLLTLSAHNSPLLTQITKLKKLNNISAQGDAKKISKKESKETQIKPMKNRKRNKSYIKPRTPLIGVSPQDGLHNQEGDKSKSLSLGLVSPEITHKSSLLQMVNVAKFNNTNMNVSNLTSLMNTTPFDKTNNTENCEKKTEITKPSYYDDLSTFSFTKEIAESDLIRKPGSRFTIGNSNALYNHNISFNSSLALSEFMGHNAHKHVNELEKQQDDYFEKSKMKEVANVKQSKNSRSVFVKGKRNQWTNNPGGGVSGASGVSGTSGINGTSGIGSNLNGSISKYSKIATFELNMQKLGDNAKNLLPRKRNVSKNNYRNLSPTSALRKLKEKMMQEGLKEINKNNQCRPKTQNSLIRYTKQNNINQFQF
jgi:hypothetical protein